MRYEFDWKAFNAYNYLDNLGFTAFAWEFLRRNSEYQQDYHAIATKGDTTPEMSDLLAQRWGLRFAVDPALPADRATVVWLPHLNPTTVVVARAPDEFTDARSIKHLTPAFSRRGANGEYWLLDRGGDVLQLALIDGADTASPAAVVIPLDDVFATRVEAARLLWRVITGHTSDPAPNGLTEQQHSRLRSILRALDGLLAGSSYRTIAKVLFSPISIPTGPEWKTHELRGRTVRLCRRGLDLMHGEYLNLLRQPRHFRD